MILLDTCIIIDYLRGKPDAVLYIETLKHPPSVSAVTIAELYGGVRGNREKQVLRALVEVLQVYTVDAQIAELSGQWWQKYRSSHGLDLIDALIGATAKAYNLELVTLNIKHFPMFDGLIRPY